jgi:pentatricopeptide repeat protein
MRWAKRALELEPDAFLSLWAPQLAFYRNQEWSKAIEAGDLALAMSGRAPLALPTLALSLIENGQLEEARSVYQEMRSRSRREPIAPTGMAMVAAAIGDKEAAIELAREAFRRHDPQLPIFARVWRQPLQLRALPEFQEILAALKLPESGAASGIEDWVSSS